MFIMCFMEMFPDAVDIDLPMVSGGGLLIRFHKIPP
jgi:hypothetical protein